MITKSKMKEIIEISSVIDPASMLEIHTGTFTVTHQRTIDRQTSRGGIPNQAMKLMAFGAISEAIWYEIYGDIIKEIVKVISETNEESTKKQLINFLYKMERNNDNRN